MWLVQDACSALHALGCGAHGRLQIMDWLAWMWSQSHMHACRDVDAKRVYYLSMEFLMGRSLLNALNNVGVVDQARPPAILDPYADMDKNLHFLVKRFPVDTLTSHATSRCTCLVSLILLHACQGMAARSSQMLCRCSKKTRRCVLGGQAGLVLSPRLPLACPHPAPQCTHAVHGGAARDGLRAGGPGGEGARRGVR